MPRVVHFEIQADDPARAVKFYETVFDWRTQKWEGLQDYWLVTTGEDSQPGINGAIMHRTDPKATVYNTVDVPSVDEFLQKITNGGGKVVMPKSAIPGLGYVAYCTDTEGNVFGIFHDDPSAQ